MHTMESTAIHSGAGASHDAATASRSERNLLTLLSVIAGMLDLIGFLRLGMFTAHITGNVVVIGPLVVPTTIGQIPRRFSLFPFLFSQSPPPH